ncbi:hypothetical protein GJAV_G00168950 [Gymnothorax javanicus]|nr:hypothetical protein GJAV_G00168950 [Gymnothorax javanicus]
MSNSNNYLDIPSHEALLSPKSTEESENSPVDDEDEEEVEEQYTLVPRSSPVPRRRGLSVFDETVEYMKIRLTQPSRRVSFIDSQGGDLVEVKEFVAFDSEEEEDPRWEIEEARYRPVPHEPIYQPCPDFDPPSSAALMLAVRNNKIEMEHISIVEGDPLSFTGLIRVLNICFNKSVYVRFTMDGWSTFFDYPADYVQGSNDVETDQYSFKLCFAAPYTKHGSKIEFVLRYETPEGDYWANNGGKNYAVVLHVSYTDDIGRGHGMDDRELKSILKPASSSMEGDSEELWAADIAEEESRSSGTDAAAPKCTPILPQFTQPKIDIEPKDATSSFPYQSDADLQIDDNVPICASANPSESPPSFPTAEKAEVFAPIEPPITSLQFESPLEARYLKHDWGAEQLEDNSPSGREMYSYDTETPIAISKNSKATIEVSSESNIFHQTTAETSSLPHIEDDREKDQQVVEGESDSGQSYEMHEPSISTTLPSKYSDTDHALQTEPSDQNTPDREGYPKSYQSLVSEWDITEYPTHPQAAKDPEEELSALRAAVMASHPVEVEVAGQDASAPVYTEPIQSEEQISQSPEQSDTAPSQAPALHILPDELAAKFDELLLPSGYDQGPTESLLEPSVATLAESSYAWHDPTGEITRVTPPDSTVLFSQDNDAVAQSESLKYAHVPGQRALEECAEEYSYYNIGTSDSPLQGIDGLEQEKMGHQLVTEMAMPQSCTGMSNSQGLETLDYEEMGHQLAAELMVSQSDVTSDSAPPGLEGLLQAEMVHQRATELAAPPSGQLASRLHKAFVTSSVFLTFACCLALAYHHLNILPLVLLYLFVLTCF